MKIIIAGSRDMPFSDFATIQTAIDASGFNVTEVVSGTAKGADSLGAHWAMLHNVPVKEFPADWESNHHSAGFIRNKQMAEYADGLIVFIYYKSHGSKHMLRTMAGMGKPCYVVRHNGEEE